MLGSGSAVGFLALLLLGMVWDHVWDPFPSENMTIFRLESPAADAALLWPCSDGKVWTMIWHALMPLEPSGKTKFVNTDIRMVLGNSASLLES